MVNTFPLTQPQERIWYTQQIYPDSPMFNIGGIVLIHGCINMELLLEAINNTISLHDAFRLQLSSSDGEKPVQYLVGQAPKCTEMLDFSKEDTPSISMRRYFQRRFEEKFELFDNSLFEFAVFKVSDDLFGYFVKLNHIIADGWSFQLLTRAIGKAYDELLQGRCNNESSSYIHFIKEDQEYVNSERYQKDKLFWNNKFTPIPEKMRDIHKSVEGKRKTFFLDKTLTCRILSFCQKNRIIPND